MSGTSELPLVMAIGGDPGGANALAPVISHLSHGGRVRVEAHAYRQARTVWEKRRLTFNALEEAGEPTLPSDTRLLLTSTSVNGIDFEKRLTVAAKLRGIPSVSVLDFWSNYRRRFSSDGNALDCLPEKIAIMDARARDEMLEEGFDAENLVITGQPAFDSLAEWRTHFTSERRKEARAELGVAPNGLLVLFASQPFYAFRESGSVLPEYPGYDERAVASLLLQALEQIAAETAREVTLVIRQHPREEPASFDALKGNRVRLHVTSEGDGLKMACAADLVTGMSTVLLVEACYLGCVVASLQPNLRLSDALPTNRLGYSRAVYREEEILPTVRELLLDESTRRAAREKLTQFQPVGDAAQRIADLVYSLLQSHLTPLHS